MAQETHEPVPRIFLVPSPRLGATGDVYPERITSAQNEWITLSREVLTAKRAAAAKGWKAGSEISEDHQFLRPFGAQFCPALQEVSSIGWLLKWPASAVLQRLGPRAWQAHLAPANHFYKHHGMTSFPEAGQSDVLSIAVGWVVVTPPGWSILVKNIPNNLSGAAHGITFAEGVIRTDQATIPIQVHAFIPPAAPDRIEIRRGDPMCLIMPFRRERLELQVMDDPASIEDAVREALADHESFANAPGRYRALYIEQESLSPLYDLFQRRAEERGSRPVEPEEPAPREEEPPENADEGDD